MNVWSEGELCSYLNDFSERLTQRTEEVHESLRSLSSSTSGICVALENATNKFAILSNSQFIENRVYEDEETLFEKSCPKPGIVALDNDFDKLSMQETLNMAIKLGLEASRSQNQYEERPLPHIIGTRAFFDDPLRGLGVSVDESTELPTYKEEEVVVRDSRELNTLPPRAEKKLGSQIEDFRPPSQDAQETKLPVLFASSSRSALMAQIKSRDTDTTKPKDNSEGKGTIKPRKDLKIFTGKEDKSGQDGILFADSGIEDGSNSSPTVRRLENKPEYAEIPGDEDDISKGGHLVENVLRSKMRMRSGSSVSSTSATSQISLKDRMKRLSPRNSHFAGLLAEEVSRKVKEQNTPTNSSNQNVFSESQTLESHPDNSTKEKDSAGVGVSQIHNESVLDNSAPVAHVRHMENGPENLLQASESLFSESDSDTNESDDIFGDFRPEKSNIASTSTRLTFSSAQFQKSSLVNSDESGSEDEGLVFDAINTVSLEPRRSDTTKESSIRVHQYVKPPEETTKILDGSSSLLGSEFAIPGKTLSSANTNLFDAGLNSGVGDEKSVPKSNELDREASNKASNEASEAFSTMNSKLFGRPSVKAGRRRGKHSKLRSMSSTKDEDDITELNNGSFAEAKERKGKEEVSLINQDVPLGHPKEVDENADRVVGQSNVAHETMRSNLDAMTKSPTDSSHVNIDRSKQTSLFSDSDSDDSSNDIFKSTAKTGDVFSNRVHNKGEKLQVHSSLFGDSDDSSSDDLFK